MNEALSQYLDREAQAAVDRAIKARRRDLQRPRIVVQRPSGVTLNPDDGALHHEALPRVLAALEVVGCVLLIGPSGCGKSRLVEDAAMTLGYPEDRYEPVTLSEGVGEHHLLGRVLPDAGGAWRHHDGPVTRAYEQGGLLFLDELDAAEPNAVLALNSALAGTRLPLPMRGKAASRNPEFRYAAAMNTVGLGADHLHSGRRGQDAALLDRFAGVKVLVDYDERLERAIAEQYLDPEPATRLLKWVQALRRRIADEELPRVASTRLVERGAMLLAGGLPFGEVARFATCDWEDG